LLVEPGFFRTELLSTASTTYAKPSIDDYAERTRETVTAWSGINGKQGGDPAKLANAIVQPAGADAVRTFESKANALLAQAGAYRDLSSSLSYADA
jgi:hypothetical protein